jgi:hypothetical protein
VLLITHCITDTGKQLLFVAIYATTQSAPSPQGAYNQGVALSADLAVVHRSIASANTRLQTKTAAKASRIPM